MMISRMQARQGVWRRWAVYGSMVAYGIGGACEARAVDVASVGGESSDFNFNGKTTMPNDAIEASSETTADGSGGSWTTPFVLNYTNILYGPSIQGASSYQPDSSGRADTTRPVFMKNFLSVAYGLNENWAITGSAYWFYRPVLGQQLTMQDPFARISDASVFSTDWGLNLYADMRVHFGVTSASREAGFYTGVQNFQYLTFQPANGRFIFALRASARYNFFDSHGVGTDAEFYLAPEVNFRINNNFALTGLYEMGASHQFGDPLRTITNDGTDFQPGVEWDPTPNLTVNPYLTILTGGKVTWRSTSVGMFFTWNFL